MGGVTDFLFGGTDTSAQDASLRLTDEKLQLFDKLAGQARGDVLGILPTADANRNLGFQAALDVLGQGANQQLNTFQQGNVGAQQTVSAGLPQFQNAILGLPTDFSGLQPQTIGFDSGFLNQQLPEFQQSAPVINQQNQQSLENSLADLLSGNFNGGSSGGLGDAFQQLQDGFDPGGANQGAGIAGPVGQMTTSQLNQSLSQLQTPTNKALSFLSPLGLQTSFSKFRSKQIQDELAARSAFGNDGFGNVSTDPSGPGGIGGSAGDAASTGGGGFGPDMGGDGGFGL